MAYYKIKPTQNLKGTVKISGSKNSSLPLLAASLLSDGEVILNNVPNLSDISNMILLLTKMGAECKKISENSYSIINKKTSAKSAPIDIVGRLRGSFLILGPI
ncbi:MAG: UDP-N-acetylglucosamine 1-carboxyvinyltransferase, partial [Alphaproteobacteria bacterium]|nr:UDP-N-acetylglucosamine 1-carboxyvinyltransferase [Alphaproteobacteria bacterium]